MSMVRKVVAAIQERGPSTPDDLMPAFPDEPRWRVAQALCNACAYGHLYVYEYGKRPFGQRGGKTPARYAILPAEQDQQADPPRGRIPNVSSVWGLGAA